jgi:hypothetical protein
MYSQQTRTLTIQIIKHATHFRSSWFNSFQSCRTDTNWRHALREWQVNVWLPIFSDVYWWSNMPLLGLFSEIQEWPTYRVRSF